MMVVLTTRTFMESLRMPTISLSDPHTLPDIEGVRYDPPKPEVVKVRRSIWAQKNGTWEKDSQCIGCQFALACGTTLEGGKNLSVADALALMFGVIDLRHSYFKRMYPKGCATLEFQRATAVANRNRDEAALTRLFAEKGIKLEFVD
jgi:hypothetical protein